MSGDYDIRERIAAWREYRKMSRQDLADEVGVSVAAVYQWEGTGEHQTTPSHANLAKICDAFEITISRFHGALPGRRAS